MATAGSSSGAAAANYVTGDGGTDGPADLTNQPGGVEEGGNRTLITKKTANQEAKEAALRYIEPPPGYRRCTVPPKTATRSSVYDHGVRFEQDCSNPDEKKQKWLCACSASCRASSMRGEGAIQCQRSNTGNITRHLDTKHGVQTGKTRTTNAAKAPHAASVSTHKVAVLKGEDPARGMMLMYVKVFIVGHLLAFSLSDSANVRMFFKVCCDALFPQTKMCPEMIKHYVVELYNSTASKFSQKLRNAVAGAGAPALHANFDLWTSKTSNEKYIGLRLFWSTAQFVLDSALIAVKLFQPDAALSETTQLSDALRTWVEEALKEFGLTPSQLFGTVTDAGSNAKRLCLKVLNSEWEWCFPHMLNCALVEAFGANASQAACKNHAARSVTDAVKKVVEHLNKSNVMKVEYEDRQHLMFGKATKLVNAVPHRWISICNVLEQIICNWAALEEHYLKNEVGDVFPLAVHEAAIEELYSLMKPVAVLMKDSERSSLPTGLSTYIDLVVLRSTTLDAEKPLTVTVPCETLAGEAGATKTTTSVVREAADLQTVTTITRELLLVALNKRFFDKRYNENVPANPTPAYVFEMAACMSPFFVKLQWLPVVCSSSEEAQRLSDLIQGKVVDLMVSMAEGVGAKPEEGVKVEAAAPPRKRKHPAGLFARDGISKKQSSDRTQRLAASGLFGEQSSGKPKDEGPSKLTIREICQEEFDRFKARFKDAVLEDYPVADLLEFWVSEGQSLYQNMARVARVLLSVPASSVVLERDFSTAGRLVTGPHSRPNAAHAEMVLFLNGNQEYIPMEVPSLSREQAEAAVPRRLSNPTEKVEKLSIGEEDHNDGTDEYEHEAETSAW